MFFDTHYPNSAHVTPTTCPETTRRGRLRLPKPPPPFALTAFCNLTRVQTCSREGKPEAIVTQIESFGVVMPCLLTLQCAHRCIRNLILLVRPIRFCHERLSRASRWTASLYSIPLQKTCPHTPHRQGLPNSSSTFACIFFSAVHQAFFHAVACEPASMTVYLFWVCSVFSCRSATACCSYGGRVCGADQSTP